MRAGGMVYVRIGSNTQYGLNAAFLTGVYADYLAEANINQVVCGATAFTRADITAFSDSQVLYRYSLQNYPLSCQVTSRIHIQPI